MEAKKEKTKVFLTVDTEHSIGGAFNDPRLKPVNSSKRIFGRIGKKEYGIPLMMDIADGFGLKMVFFLEVLNRYFFEEGESRQVCRYILHRDHDVQVHAHPNYLNFTRENPGELEFSDFISAYPKQRQVELLTEAKNLLVKYGAPVPTAFRAGCFGAGLSTLSALEQAGYLYDSSFNRAYCGVTCSIPNLPVNDVVQMEGVLEFPVTNFIEQSHIRSKRFMPLDMNGVSYNEMKHALLQSRQEGISNITVILHSFSFIKAFDVQYRKVKPRWTVIKRFKNLCRFLAKHSSQFEVRTFNSIRPDEIASFSQNTSHSFVKMPPLISIIRGIEQVKDNIV